MTRQNISHTKDYLFKVTHLKNLKSLTKPHERTEIGNVFRYTETDLNLTIVTSRSHVITV